MAPVLRSPDYTARLPAEVLLCFFDSLCQADILGAALVSRRWRSAAIRHHNHYAYLELLPTGAAPWSSDVDFRVALFCRSLRYCVRHQLKLNLRLYLDTDPRGWMEDVNGIKHDYSWLGLDASGDPYADRILPALKGCLALVVSLRVYATREYYKSLYSALCTPAPRLTHLELNLSDLHDYSHGLEAEELEGPPLPAEFLGRHAPLLRDVILFYVQLPTAPIRVFADVPKVDLTCRFQPPLDHVESIFPRATNLFFRGGWRLPDAEAYAPKTTFAGLEQLGLYAVMDLEWTPDLQEAMRHCRSVHIDNTNAELFLSPLLGHLEGPLSVTLDKHNGTHFYARLEVTEISVAESQFHRKLDFDDYHYLDKFLPQFASHVGSVVELDMHYQFLAGLIEGLDELPQLVALTVEISDMQGGESLWRPTYMDGFRGVSVLAGEGLLEWRPGNVPLDALYPGDARFHIRCPKLEQLVLQRDSAEEPITIDSFEMMHLARDLSLLRDDRKPFVVLYKDASQVEFVGPRFKGLDMIFVNDIWVADFLDHKSHCSDC